MEEIEKEILELENKVNSISFWDNKEEAKNTLAKIKILKESLNGGKEFDKGGAILNILSGAGGDDAEDFSYMLFNMYEKYCLNNNFKVFILDKNENTLGGFRNISIEISGKNVYGNLKNESGVHRLIRISPFNAKSLRQTSFSLVEILPIIKNEAFKQIDSKDLKIDFLRSGGPGGQNVNKRETAVRVTHIPTGLTVCVDGEREQNQNKEKALEILNAKLFKIDEENKKLKLENKQISKNVDIEWGSQIRTYTLHPYKMVKDHRTEVETSDIKKVLESGYIDDFIEAEKNL
jgi:peptide chain release factor 2